MSGASGQARAKATVSVVGRLLRDLALVLLRLSEAKILLFGVFD
jgi:hypothetical protein